MSALLSTLKFHTHSYWFHSGPHLQNYQRLWSVVDSSMLLIFPSFPNTTVTFFGEHSHGTQISHVIFIHSESSVNIILRFSCISSHFPSTSTNILLNHWPQPMNWYIVTHLPLSLSKQSNQPGVRLKVLPTKRFPHHQCPSGMSQSGAVGQQMSPFWWCLHTMLTHLGLRAPVLSSLFTHYRELPRGPQVHAARQTPL